MGSIGAVGAAAGLVVAVLLRWLPGGGRADGLSAVGVAGVRGGAAAALGVAVVELHLAGTVEAARNGRLRRLVHTDPGPGLTPLHRALWAAFGRELSLSDAAGTPTARRARAELLADLAARGLRCGRARLAAATVAALAACGTGAAVAALGNPGAGLPTAVLSAAVLAAPARTLAGHRLLRALRRRHPLPPAAPTGPTAETGLLVALHGRRALRLLLPDFAARTTLLGGRALQETVARDSRDPYGLSSSSSGGDPDHHM
ncbi:hypothetical protein HUT16_28510 [Kitasatospora sp. NA04385]|uniref:hypothetical protein n=1 Tax=Kitasatospora sp. NA04385 TaxID=2742135 RepID=UPI00159026C2|nr:hypothetical protein [Kitasatospora sp. NA04385]QKW22498.1 hypothetical protein HUT16_28510 [Kitasatospora sp. NA04385]